MKPKNPKTPPADPQPRKKRGALMVYEKLRDDIQWMRIAPGSALDEVALAQAYEVSRTPIREALLLLVNEGFVQFLQNRTTIVAPLSMHNQNAFLDTFILLSRGLIRATTMHGPVDRDALAPYLDDYSEGLAENDVERAFRAQLGLFRHLTELAKNRFLAKYFLEAQDASVRMKLLYFFPHLSADDIATARIKLEAVIDAVAAGDPEAGDRAVSDVILFETQVIQRGIEPRFGHQMTLESPGTGGTS